MIITNGESKTRRKYFCGIAYPKTSEGYNKMVKNRPKFRLDRDNCFSQNVDLS